VRPFRTPVIRLPRALRNVKIREAINRAQHMAHRNVPLERELVEQRVLHHLLIAQHRLRSPTTGLNQRGGCTATSKFFNRIPKSGS
jgi:hypothetical protein